MDFPVTLERSYLNTETEYMTWVSAKTMSLVNG